MIPTTKIELGFDSNGPGNWFVLDSATRGLLDGATYTLSGAVYYDVTQYVKSVSTTRGKNRELDRFNAGRIAVTFDNRNRFFDPTYAASPFYGQIVPRRGIRMSVNNQVQFTGIVDDWNLSYSPDRQSEASLTGFDGFSLLSGQKLTPTTMTSQLSGARINAVLNDPNVNWSFTDRNIDAGSETLQADVVASNTDVVGYINLIEHTEPGVFFVDKTNKATWVQRNKVWESSGVLTTRTNLVTNPSVESALTNWLGNLNAIARVTTDAYSGSACVEATFAGTAGDIFVAPNGNNMQPVTPNLNYSLSVWVKDVSTFNNFQVGIDWYTSSSAYISSSVGTFSAVSTSNWTQVGVASVAPPTAANAIYRIRPNGTPAVGTKARFDAALFEQSSTVGAYFDGYTTPNSSWDYRWNGIPNASTSLASSTTMIPSVIPTIADDGSGIPYHSVNVVYGSELLYNQVTASRLSGGTVTTNNTSSQTTYGVRALNETGLLHSTDAALTNLANYLVNQYSNPEFRFESIEIMLNDLSNSQQATLFGLEIGQLCKIIFTPNGITPSIVKYAEILGVSQNRSIDSHSIVFNFQTLDQSLLVLNDSVFGLLDLNSLGY